MKKSILKISNSFKKMSLNAKLKLFGYGIIIPFAGLTMYLLICMVRYCESYNQIVKNITMANQYNINFKDEVDYSTYRMIVRPVSAEKLEAELGFTNPYSAINELRDVFDKLYEITTVDENRGRLTIIFRLVDILEKRLDEINLNIIESGHYDENIELLDNNVRILTQLIQSYIQEFIYYETANLESTRQALKSSEFQSLGISICFFAVIIIYSSILSMRISKSISKPIQKLCKVTEKVAKGDFNTRAEIMAVDEISILTHSFNSMTKEIGELVDNIRNEQENLRVTELKLLQAQIKPHFLYNTLDTIVWLAEDLDTKGVVSMVTSLSDFFRTALSEGKDFITVRDEIRHVRSYLEIQQVRYRDILDFEIDIPDELWECYVLKLILQPIVENALYHGIKNKRGKGKITIRAFVRNTYLQFTIEDTGIGMRIESLKELQEKIKKPILEKDEVGAFGLRNVDLRIRMAYGEDYGLFVSSEWEVGTRVMIRLPKDQ